MAGPRTPRCWVCSFVHSSWRFRIRLLLRKCTSFTAIEMWKNNVMQNWENIYSLKDIDTSSLTVPCFVSSSRIFVPLSQLRSYDILPRCLHWVPFVLPFSNTKGSFPKEAFCTLIFLSSLWFYPLVLRKVHARLLLLGKATGSTSEKLKVSCATLNKSYGKRMDRDPLLTSETQAPCGPGTHCL